MSDPASTYPLIELHRHIEGAMRLRTIRDLAEQHGLPLPRDLDALRPLVQVTEPEPDLLGFLARIDTVDSVFVTLDDCARATYECVGDAQAEGLAYLELRWSPVYMGMPHKLNPAAVVEAVADGARRGERDFGVRTNLIGILCRSFGPESAYVDLEALLAHRESITALDLAGDELHFPGDLFVDHFRRGREAGWRITVHAGEAGGARGVWQALIDLGAERIGHGTHAIDDPLLVDYLAEHHIGIESSITSNVQTSTVPDFASHPLRQFLEHGLLATINTDDPSISGIDYAHELTVAAPAAGLTPAQIRQAQANAIEIAFLSEQEKAALRARIA